MDAAPDASGPPGEPEQRPDLSVLVVTLLKGVIYRESDPRLWASLMDLQPQVRDYVAVLALDLVLDEAEGYAFLRGRPEPEGDGAGARVPRLVARRPLSFPVSLLLALLRRKLAELDAGGAETTRLVLTREEIADLMRLFLPESSNEARLMDQIDAHVNKVVDLGFLRRLRPAGGSTAGSGSGPASFEVRRILKAFVDAQWLAELDARLEAYRAHLAGGAPAPGDGDD